MSAFRRGARVCSWRHPDTRGQVRLWGLPVTRTGCPGGESRRPIFHQKFVIPAGALAERGEPGPSRTDVCACHRDDGDGGRGSFRNIVGQNAWIAVYIMASARNGTPYTGVTSALVTRVQQHKLGALEGFSKECGCKILVRYETHPTMPEAIPREKRIKRWRRDWKLALIEGDNPQWRDLSEGGFEVPEGPLSWTQRPQR